MSWSLSTTVAPTFWPSDGFKMLPIEQLKDSKKVFPVFQKPVSPATLPIPPAELSIRQHVSLHPQDFILYTHPENIQSVLPVFLEKVRRWPLPAGT